MSAPPGICRPRQSLVQILIVLSWKHVNQAWKLFGSCKVGGYGLSIPKAFVETSLLIFPVTHYDKMHIQTPHNCLCLCYVRNPKTWSATIAKLGDEVTPYLWPMNFISNFQERTIAYNHWSSEATYGWLCVCFHLTFDNLIQSLWSLGIFLALSTTKNHGRIANPFAYLLHQKPFYMTWHVQSQQGLTNPYIDWGATQICTKDVS